MSALNKEFQKFCLKNTEGNFVEWLRNRSSTSWEKMVYHRFTIDVEKNTIPEDVFKKYLQLEHKFVRSAITIFAYALAKAMSIDDQNRLISILSALGNEQDDYFQKTFTSMGVKEKELSEFKLDGKIKLDVYNLDRLPEKQRKVIELSFINDMTQDEIAVELNIPIGTVKSRMRLAYQKMKDNLKDITA